MTHIDLVHLPTLAYLAVLLFLFAAGMTKGLIGIGMPIVAVPLLNIVLDLPATVALLSVPLIITNIPQALAGDTLSVVLGRLAPIFGGLVIGVFVGISLLATIGSATLKPIVGLVLIAIAALMWFAPRFTVAGKLERVASPAAGFVGGVAGGLAALPGPFVFVYLLALGIERDRFVQYSSMFLTVAAILMTLMLGGRGLLGWKDTLVSTLASLPIFAGMWIGGHVRRFVPSDLFRRVILGVVLVSGVYLAASGGR